VKRIDLEPNCTKLTVNVQSLLEQLAHVKKERLIEFAINTSQNKISAKVDNQAIILDTKSVERKSMLFFNKMVEVQYKLLTSKSKFYFQY
ncbi:glycosyltransferase family 2 protein, partial [Bacillus spizizenii]